jgi:enterochelin esterase-like enzyme
MRRRRIIVAISFAIVAAAALAGGTAVGIASKRAPQPAVHSPARTVAVNCHSLALGGSLPAVVYLPAGYSASAKPYPVIYFLHGLPAGPDSYKENTFVAGAVAAARQRAIVVASQGARDSDSDREYLDWSPTEDWPAAIAHDLPSCIDARYNTIDSRYGRALIGLSAGGYGAFNIGLRNLATFGAVESWSGYFVATDPTGDRVLDLGTSTANANARVPSGSDLETEVSTWPSLIDFYVGRQDSRFLGMNQAFDSALTRSGVRHLFKVYPGGHSGALWRSEAPPWLTMALRFLAGRARHPGKPG